jgi:hypothetical protein
MGPETVLSSPQREVLLKDDLAGNILLFAASHSDFRALVRACIRPAARRDFRKTYIERLITETGDKVADMVDTTLLASLNEVNVKRSEPFRRVRGSHSLLMRADGGPSVSCGSLAMPQWLTERERKGDSANAECINNVQAGIRSLASSLKSIVKLAISSDSGREIRRRFWPQEGLKGE